MIHFLNVNKNGFKLILITRSLSSTCMERKGKEWSQITEINYTQPAAFLICSATHTEQSQATWGYD